MSILISVNFKKNLFIIAITILQQSQAHSKKKEIPRIIDRKNWWTVREYRTNGMSDRSHIQCVKN